GALQLKMIRRVQVEEKLTCTGGLSRLANRRGRTHQAIQATQETTIILVFPRQWLRAAPPGGAGTVETAVVANTKEGVGGDDVIRQGQFTQSRPGAETGGITRRDSIQSLPIG